MNLFGSKIYLCNWNPLKQLINSLLLAQKYARVPESTKSTSGKKLLFESKLVYSSY